MGLRHGLCELRRAEQLAAELPIDLHTPGFRKDVTPLIRTSGGLRT
jgi:hypothetical protein